MRVQQKHYVYGYEVSDDAPFPHYYEEILPHISVLKKYGLRGDANYLFYSNKKLGQAMYEETEQRLSAEATYAYLSEQKNSHRYFTDVAETIKNVTGHVNELNQYQITDLSNEDLVRFFKRTYELMADTFALSIACQPHRTRLFEEEVKKELKKRVAAQRIDAYLAALAVSEKPTEIIQEEIDWAKLLVDHYEAPDKAIAAHYNRYKLLTLGDGVWQPDPEVYRKKFDQDSKKPKTEWQEQYAQIVELQSEKRSKRRQLINELSLSEEARKTIELLADLGYYRLMLRTDGYMPLIFSGIAMRIEIARRRGIKDDLGLFFLKPEEMEQFLDNKFEVTDELLARRRGEDDEFLIYLEDGNAHFLYGYEAGEKYRELVPPKTLELATEVKGSPAMRGFVRGRVCLFIWGDNIEEKVKQIADNPILVAGHTRPAMMPIIRQAQGIVTDEGGVTSHAAIISRELGIPSVINTHDATRVFKNGDLVDLDAEHGVVRKVEE